MSEPTSSSAPVGTEPLQFDRAEFDAASQEAPQKLQCAACNKPLLSSYYELNGVPACAECREKAEKGFRPRPGVSGFLKAVGIGLGGAAVGAGIYYAILALTGYEVGLISILVGFLAGAGVKKGSGGYGGWKYQTLAVGLTYVAICCTYIPMIYNGMKEQATAAALEPEAVQASAAPVAIEASPDGTVEAVGVEDLEEEAAPGWFMWGIIFVIALAAPFLAGFENILGIAIIGFGLYQAWAINKAPVLAVAGPFPVGDQRFAMPPIPSEAPAPLSPS